MKNILNIERNGNLEDDLSKLYDSAQSVKERLNKLIQYQIMFNIIIPVLIILDILLGSYSIHDSSKHSVLEFPTFIIGSFVMVSSMLLIGFALYIVAVLLHSNPSVRLRSFLTIIAIVLHEIAVNGIKDLILLPWKGLGRMLKGVILGKHSDIDPADVFTPLRVSATGLALSVQVPIIILSIDATLLISNTTKLYSVITSGFLLPVQVLINPTPFIGYGRLHGFILILVSSLLLTYVTTVAYIIFKGINKDINNFKEKIREINVAIKIKKTQRNERKNGVEFEKEKETCITLFEDYKNKVSQSRIRGSSRVLVHRYNIFMAFAKELRDVLVVEIQKNKEQGDSEADTLSLLDYAVRVMQRLYDLRGIKVKEAGTKAEEFKKVYENFFISYTLTLIMTFGLGASLELTKRETREKYNVEKIIKSMVTLLALAEVLKIRVNVVDLCVALALAVKNH